MGDRIAVLDLATTACNHHKNNKLQILDEQCQPEEMALFIGDVINEQLPDKTIKMEWADVGVAYNEMPKATLKEIKEFAQSTISLEEGYRYWQVYCEPPHGGPPLSLPQPAGEVMCSYFKSEWEKKFPLKYNSVMTTAVFPVEEASDSEEDGDTDINCFAGKGKACHTVRYTAVDTQESIEYNDFVTEVRKEDIKTVPSDWNIIDTPYCYKHPRKDSTHCVLHVRSPNTKINRHADEVWGALAGLMAVEDPSLAVKFSNVSLSSALKKEMLGVGRIATIYRGKLATKIKQDIFRYADLKGCQRGLEPSYAVPSLSKDDIKEGRFEGVDRYGRLLGWKVLKHEDILLNYLADEKEGLSAFAASKLKEFYEFNRAQVNAMLGKINFKKFGLTKKEEERIKELFLTLVIDPSVEYSAEKTKEMAKRWSEISKHLEKYHYTNNLNLFLIFIGQGVETGRWFPNLRSYVAYHVLKTAAEMKNGHFASPVFFQAYAPNDQKK